METLVCNLKARVRQEVWNGRTYLAAPITLIVPGVLNGSKGPLYYPPEEVSKDYSAWNHVPLVLDHPEKDGEPCSARDPEILEQVGLGYVFNAHMRNGLKAEAWFDIEKTRRVDKRIIERLKKGIPIEISTGLYTDNEPITGTFNGRHYDYIARNYRPDHLAILPDRPGACSIQDGCGVLVNSSKKGQSMFTENGEFGYSVNVSMEFDYNDSDRLIVEKLETLGRSLRIPNNKLDEFVSRAKKEVKRQLLQKKKEARQEFWTTSIVLSGAAILGALGTWFLTRNTSKRFEQYGMFHPNPDETLNELPPLFSELGEYGAGRFNLETAKRLARKYGGRVIKDAGGLFVVMIGSRYLAKEVLDYFKGNASSEQSSPASITEGAGVKAKPSVFDRPTGNFNLPASLPKLRGLLKTVFGQMLELKSEMRQLDTVIRDSKHIPGYPNPALKRYKEAMKELGSLFKEHDELAAQIKELEQTAELGKGIDFETRKGLFLGNAGLTPKGYSTPSNPKPKMPKMPKGVKKPVLPKGVKTPKGIKKPAMPKLPKPPKVKAPLSARPKVPRKQVPLRGSTPEEKSIRGALRQKNLESFQKRQSAAHAAGKAKSAAISKQYQAERAAGAERGKALAARYKSKREGNYRASKLQSETYSRQQSAKRTEAMKKQLAQNSMFSINYDESQPRTDDGRFSFSHAAGAAAKTSGKAGAGFLAGRYGTRGGAYAGMRAGATYGKRMGKIGSAVGAGVGAVAGGLAGAIGSSSLAGTVGGTPAEMGAQAGAATSMFSYGQIGRGTKKVIKDTKNLVGEAVRGSRSMASVGAKPKAFDPSEKEMSDAMDEVMRRVEKMFKQQKGEIPKPSKWQQTKTFVKTAREFRRTMKELQKAVAAAQGEELAKVSKMNPKELAKWRKSEFGGPEIQDWRNYQGRGESKQEAYDRMDRMRRYAQESAQALEKRVGPKKWAEMQARMKNPMTGKDYVKSLDVDKRYHKMEKFGSAVAAFSPIVGGIVQKRKRNQQKENQKVRNSLFIGNCGSDCPCKKCQTHNADPEGKWITTDTGKHILIGKGGKIKKGNIGQKNAPKGGGSKKAPRGSKAMDKHFEGKTYINPAHSKEKQQAIKSLFEKPAHDSRSMFGKAFGAARTAGMTVVGGGMGALTGSMVGGPVGAVVGGVGGAAFGYKGGSERSELDRKSANYHAGMKKFADFVKAK